MFIIAQYSTRLDIESCIAFYENFEHNLLSRVKELYEGMCLNGCLIVRIHQITRYGKCQFLSATDPTRGTLSVAFTARVVQYAQGDIIGGCIARDVSDRGNRVPALTPYYAELIFTRDNEVRARDEALSVVSPGATMIACARVAMANPGANRISIQAQLYEPITRSRYYPISRIAIAGIQGAQYWIPSELRGNEDSGSLSAFDYLSEIRAIWQREVTALDKKFAGIADNVMKLFRSHTAREEGTFVSILDIARDPDTTLRDVGAIIINHTLDPFDAIVQTIGRDVAQSPDWDRVHPCQPRIIVAEQCIEYFANIYIAAIETLRALMNPACAKASQALIRVQINRARK